jgi:AcrR family transcriptional regulator
MSVVPTPDTASRDIPPHGKGETTRAAILDRASRLATEMGLNGVTIGRLASELHLSKSGLFAHFRSKGALQVQILETAAAKFVDEVVRPALRAARGEPRLRAIFDRWLEWSTVNSGPGGCLFVAAAVELDDRPGPVRERLVALQKEWLDLIANVYRAGVTEGELSSSVDPEQFAHDLYSVMLGYHHASRLMRDPKASARAHAGFETLMSTVRRRSA